MSNLIDTVRKHLVIDGKNGQAFAIDGVKPTRWDGRWVDLPKADRPALVEHAVCLFLGVQAPKLILSDKVAGSRAAKTYPERLRQKLDSVLSHGGEGRDTLLTETRALLKSLASQAKAPARKPKQRAGALAKHSGPEPQDGRAAKTAQKSTSKIKGPTKATKPTIARKASAKGKTNAAGKKEIVSEANGLRELDELRGELEEKVQNSRRSRPAERKKRLKTTRKRPEKIAVKSYEFRRNPDVIAEVLERADGTCEACENPAPFRRASNNEPYLEVHHKKPLSQRGEDTVENAIALCPNCHRKIHYGTQGG